MNESHAKALRELVRLFNWLDALIPQPTNEILILQVTLEEIEERIDSAMSQAENLMNVKDVLKEIHDLNEGNKIVGLSAP